MRRDNVQIQYESAIEEIFRKKNDRVIHRLFSVVFFSSALYLQNILLFS